MTKNYKKIFAGLLASVISVSQTVGYAAEINDSTNIQYETNENTTETSETEHYLDTRFLFLNILTAGGSVILDEGTGDEQTVKLENHDSTEMIDVYDINDVLISSENAADNGYIYVYEAEADSVVNVKAAADAGYELTEYSILGNETEEDTGFVSPMQDFEYPVFMSEDMTVKVKFDAVEEKLEDEPGSNLNDESNVNLSEDIRVSEPEEESLEESSIGNDAPNDALNDVVNTAIAQPTETPDINVEEAEETPAVVQPKGDKAGGDGGSGIENAEMFENPEIDNDIPVREPESVSNNTEEGLLIEHDEIFMINILSLFCSKCIY